MAYDESNGHMIDDVTWPRNVKVVTPKCSRPSRKWPEVQTRLQEPL